MVYTCFEYIWKNIYVLYEFWCTVMIIDYGNNLQYYYSLIVLSMNRVVCFFWEIQGNQSTGKMSNR